MLYQVDIEKKELNKLSQIQFSELKLKERYDIQEWIEKTPDILGEGLLIIYKELELPSKIRLDLLAIDKKANLVIIELKRDDSGTNVEWQAIKYASYCSRFTQEEIIMKYAEYLQSDSEDAQVRIEEFIDAEIDKINEKQRIILVSKEFHSDVASAVLWLREYGIDVSCVKFIPYVDQSNHLFITPILIIPLPEAKEYIEKKESKQKEARLGTRSSFSLERSNLPDDELEQRLITTLQRESDLTPRVIAFLEVICSEERTFKREEVRARLFDKGVGEDPGQAGRYLSNISQFLTKKSNPHLRQVIEFESGGTLGETKDNYRVFPQYRELLRLVLEKVKSKEDQYHANTFDTESVG